MRFRLKTSLVCWGAVLVPLIGCISSDSDLGDAGDECVELKGDTVPKDAAIDETVKVFMQASADLRFIGQSLRGPVKDACANIAHDLGAEDTWSAFGDSDDAIHNDEGTGACDVAVSKVSAIMTAHADANFALCVSRGACRPDFAAQAECDAGCTIDTTCDSGSVETRCEPGELAVQCSGSCEASATCEGRPELPANCMGVCESTCQGECKGTCIAADGTRTDNDPNCMGKCSSRCNGTCRGYCKIEEPAGVNCGVSVACLGGCTGTASAPVCETLFTPPACSFDAECYASCSASVASHAICDPPIVQLSANLTVHADVQLLVTTINANLASIIAVADAQGQLAIDAVKRLGTTADAVLDKADDLDGKSLSCAKAAAKISTEAAATLARIVNASASVHESCSSNAI